MKAYYFPIRAALISFPFIALIISLPLLLVEYRRYGRFNFLRALILYSFIFYLLTAYYLVILPLPAREEVANYTSRVIEIRPFYTVVRFLDRTVLDLKNPATYGPAMKQIVFLEPIFNILLLLPFGVYLRYYFNLSLKKTVLLSFLLSLFFELTQLTGLYFIYPRPYRLADVNDLINNTLGGYLGYRLASIFSFFLPDKKDLDKIDEEKSDDITFVRRGLALLIDWLLIGFISKIYLALAGKDLKLGLGFKLGQVYLYFVLVQAIFQGSTMGKRLVGIRLVDKKGRRPKIYSLLKRYSLLYLPPILARSYIDYFSRLFSQDFGLKLSTSVTYIYLGLYFICLAIYIFWALSLLVNMLRKNRVLSYEIMSGTKIVKARANLTKNL